MAKIHVMNFYILRTNSSNKDFIALVNLLDAGLAELDGADHAFYSQFNGIATLNHVAVAYIDDKPVACGAIKPIAAQVMELKRMFTLPEARGKKIASKVLAELEKWAVELGYSSCLLETGLRQVEAIALYKNNGYQPITNYGQYYGIANSVCFSKFLQLK